MSLPGEMSDRPFSPIPVFVFIRSEERGRNAECKLRRRLHGAPAGGPVFLDCDFVVKMGSASYPALSGAAATFRSAEFRAAPSSEKLFLSFFALGRASRGNVGFRAQARSRRSFAGKAGQRAAVFPHSAFFSWKQLDTGDRFHWHVLDFVAISLKVPFFPICKWSRCRCF